MVTSRPHKPEYRFDSCDRNKVTVKIYANEIAVDVETSQAYRISGVYDVDGNIRREWKFRKGYEAEAHLQDDGTVIIKFEP